MTTSTETLQIERRTLVRMANAIEQFEGKNTKRLGEASCEIIRKAYEAARADYEQHALPLFPPRPTADDGKTLNLIPVRARIEKIESDIHTLDKLECMPELDEVREAMETLRAALIKLGKTDRQAEREALRLGMLPARINWIA